MARRGKSRPCRVRVNRGPKTVNEAIETVKELNEAQERLKRANKSRVQLLEESAANACVDGCNGQWISAASEILVNNDIGRESFSSAVYNALRHGRGKYRNVYIYGPANCGKTFLLSPLKKVRMLQESRSWNVCLAWDRESRGGLVE